MHVSFFSLYSKSHASMHSGTLQRVLPAVMMTWYATKTMSLLLPPIQAHAQGLSTLDSMEATGSVSAFKWIWTCPWYLVTVITCRTYCIPTLTSNLWLLYPLKRSRSIAVPMVEPVHYRSRKCFILQQHTLEIECEDLYILSWARLQSEGQPVVYSRPTTRHILSIP